MKRSHSCERSARRSTTTPSTPSRDAPAFLFQAFQQGRQSVKDLSPYRYNLFGQVGYTFHPLLKGGLASIYFPQAGSFFLNPVLTYSAFPNFDLDAVGQLLLEAKQGKFRMTSKAVFLRLKWSF